MESKALKQVEAKLLSILDDETLGVDRDNVFLAIALARKLVSNDAIESIHASPSDYGEIILNIELKNDCSLVLFLDYKENEATSYIETDKEIRAFKSFSLEGLAEKINKEVKKMKEKESIPPIAVIGTIVFCLCASFLFGIDVYNTRIADGDNFNEAFNAASIVFVIAFVLPCSFTLSILTLMHAEMNKD